MGSVAASDNLQGGARLCTASLSGDYQQYDVLYKTFGARVLVIWNRRRCERRDLNRPDMGVQLKPERRSATPPSWQALGFVVVDR